MLLTIHIHICIYIHAYMHIYEQYSVCLCICIYIYTCICYICIYVYMYMYILHVCVYVYIYIYIYRERERETYSICRTAATPCVRVHASKSPESIDAGTYLCPGEEIRALKINICLGQHPPFQILCGFGARPIRTTGFRIANIFFSRGW